eukprot:jgi/Chrzof1/2643/Cz11g23180.t1
MPCQFQLSFGTRPALLHKPITVSSKTHAQRLVLRAVSPNADRPLFQLHGNQQLTLDDVRDAYEVCSLIPAPNERQDCYSVFGIDGNRMHAYYESVLTMEKQLAATQSAQEDPDEFQYYASTQSVDS